MMFVVLIDYMAVPGMILSYLKGKVHMLMGKMVMIH